MTRLSVFVSSDGIGKSTGGSEEEDDEALETLKFNFSIESLGLVLYNNQPKQVSGTRIRTRRRFSVGFFLMILISLQPFFWPTVMSSSDQLCQFPFFSKSLKCCCRISWSWINGFRSSWSRISCFRICWSRICWSRIGCCMINWSRISCFRANLVSGFWNECSCSCSHRSSSTGRSFSWESLLSVY